MSRVRPACQEGVARSRLISDYCCSVCNHLISSGIILLLPCYCYTSAACSSSCHYAGLTARVREGFPTNDINSDCLTPSSALIECRARLLAHHEFQTSSTSSACADALAQLHMHVTFHLLKCAGGFVGGAEGQSQPAGQSACQAAA